MAFMYLETWTAELFLLTSFAMTVIRNTIVSAGFDLPLIFCFRCSLAAVGGC